MRKKYLPKKVNVVIATMVTPMERMADLARGVISWLRQKIVTLDKIFETIAT